MLRHSDVPHFFTQPGLILIVAWIAQTFLQLVLCSIVIVGQNIAAEASDKRAMVTDKGAGSILAETLEIQEHLRSLDDQVIVALRTAFATGGTWAIFGRSSQHQTTSESLALRGAVALPSGCGPAHAVRGAW